MLLTGQSAIPEQLSNPLPTDAEICRCLVYRQERISESECGSGCQTLPRGQSQFAGLDGGLPLGVIGSLMTGPTEGFQIFRRVVAASRQRQPVMDLQIIIANTRLARFSAVQTGEPVPIDNAEIDGRRDLFCACIHTIIVSHINSFGIPERQRLTPLSNLFFAPRRTLVS